VSRKRSISDRLSAGRSRIVPYCHDYKQALKIIEDACEKQRS